jgi:hypothetical protein
MKSQLFLLATCISGALAMAQTTIEFTYDNAGNRTSRIIQNPPPAKMSSDSTILTKPNSINKDLLTDEKSLIARIYPNPVKDELTIALENYTGQRLRYEIVDLGGSVWKSGEIHRENTAIEVRNLSTGVYFLSIQGDALGITQKIVVQ